MLKQVCALFFQSIMNLLVPNSRRTVYISMKRSQYLVLAYLGLSLFGCKIITTVPDGGEVASRTGRFDCPESSECVIDVVNGTVFSDTFTAVPKAGYQFTGWKEDHGFLCGGSVDSCALEGVPGEFTDQDIDLNLEPVFESIPEMQSGLDSCPEETDEEPISPGPYDHVLSVASSSDGINFVGEKPALLQRASAPDAVVGPDGKIWVYYVNGTPGQHAIFISRVEEDGSVVPFNCVKINGEVDMLAVDPDVLRLDDGSYRLFYNPLVQPIASPDEGIYSVTSSDGIHFSNKVQHIQKTGALNPSGIQLSDGNWLLTYTDEVDVFIARSEDGIDYEITHTFDAGIPELAYLSESNEARLYSAELTGLGLYESSDGGANWTRVTTTSPQVQDPSILIKSADEWMLYYRFEQ